jgi:cytochrome c556
MRRFIMLGLSSLCALGAISTALAEDAPLTPEQQAQRAVDLRQGLFKVQGFSFAPTGAMLKGAPFDAAVVLKGAMRIETTSGLIPEVFQTDTHKFQLKTKARDSIWTSKADFDTKAEDLTKAAIALEAAAKGGDKGTTLKAAAAVGKACGSCHDDFRDK